MADNDQYGSSEQIHIPTEDPATSEIPDTNLAPNLHIAELEQSSKGAVRADNDSAKTPRGEDPPALTAEMASTTESHVAVESDATPVAQRSYFGNDRPSANTLASRAEILSSNSHHSSPLQSAGASSSSLRSTNNVNFPGASADSTELYHRLIKVQSNTSASSSGSRVPGRRSSRSHTSNPSPSNLAAKGRPLPHPHANFITNEGPHYPDQSFAALHNQTYTPPYPYFRTHSPFLFNGSPASGSPNRSQEHLVMSSPINRTGGNTPVESPGLFSRRGRVMAEEMESSQYKMPSLHPTHNAAPKESHSLRKEIDAISGHKLINDYEILSELGKGTHGKVKLARPAVAVDEDQRVAIKIVRRFPQRSRLGSHEKQEDKVKKEIAVLKKARHHHVVRLIEVIDDPDWDKVYMVLEYVEEGEMKWRRKADKWVVHFERRRVEREREAWLNSMTVDLDIELAEIDEFNDKYEWRLKEKARILALQKQRAFETISSRKSSSATIFTDDEQPADATQNWSLEHGGVSGDEMAETANSRKPSRMGTAPFTVEDLSLNASPYIQQCATRSADILSFGDPFAPVSGTVSPALSTLGAPLITPSLPESIEKDKNFLRELKDIQRNDDAQNFTEQDEHFRHVPCLTLARARECFRDTVLGLEYLHYQGIIHRDIKPANLLWTKEHRVKISDFGVSYLGRRAKTTDGETEADMDRWDDDVELARTVGTPAFYAPEICNPADFLDGNDSRSSLGPAMDIWALGVTLYCMVFARLPFAPIIGEGPLSLFDVIAKHPLFIPSKRLRAIRLKKSHDHDPKDRPEDLLQYEEIDDELRDLITRLLHKDPSKRITIREIKRHPWVVRGMRDPLAWLDQTDPANYIKDKKIQVTERDVSAAIAPLTFAERFRQFGQRVSSLVRGRDYSKRAGSRSGQSAGGSSRSTGPDTKSRRASLRSEDLFSAFRARNDGTPQPSEHPLSQSQLASPIQDSQPEGYFSQISAPATVGATPTQERPGQPDRGTSLTESIRTIRAPGKHQSRPDLNRQRSWAFDGANDFDVTHSFAQEDAPTSHPASIAQRLGGTARGIAYGLTSKRSSLSVSSNSTSSDRLSSHAEDPHTMPLVGMSSAMATGRVETPSIPVPPIPQSAPPSRSNRPRAVTAPRPVTTETFNYAQMQNARLVRDEWFQGNQVQQQQWTESRTSRSRPHSRSAVPEYNSSQGPDEEMFWARQRLETRRDQSGSVSTAASASSRPPSSQHSTSLHRDISAASSSDDVQAEATFSDNSRHPSMPSVMSAGSITSAASCGMEDHLRAHAEKHEKYDKQKTYDFGLKMTKETLMSTGETVTPATVKTIAGLMQTAGSGEEKVLQGLQEKQQQKSKESRDVTVATHDVSVEEDDTGYSGDQDADEESEDEGIVFGGFHK